MSVVVSSYLLLVLGTTLYAILLERFKHLWEPDLTWLEVAIGTALCLLVPFGLARSAPADWATYELRTWSAFVVGGLPIVAWQLFRMIRSRLQTMQEAHRLLAEEHQRHANAPAAVAEQRGE